MRGAEPRSGPALGLSYVLLADILASGFTFTTSTNGRFSTIPANSREQRFGLPTTQRPTTTTTANRKGADLHRQDDSGEHSTHSHSGRGVVTAQPGANRVQSNYPKTNQIPPHLFNPHTVNLTNNSHPRSLQRGISAVPAVDAYGGFFRLHLESRIARPGPGTLPHYHKSFYPL